MQLCLYDMSTNKLGRLYESSNNDRRNKNQPSLYALNNSQDSSDVFRRNVRGQLKRNKKDRIQIYKAYPNNKTY